MACFLWLLLTAGLPLSAATLEDAACSNGDSCVVGTRSPDLGGALLQTGSMQERLALNSSAEDDDMSSTEEIDLEGKTCYEKRSVPKCGMCKNTEQCSCGFCCPGMRKCRCGSGCGGPPAGFTKLLDTCGSPRPAPAPAANSNLPADAAKYVGTCVAKIPGWKCQGRQCSGDMSRYMAGGASGECPSSNRFCKPWCLEASHSLCTNKDRWGDGTSCSCPTGTAHGCGRCPLTADEAGSVSPTPKPSGGSGESPSPASSDEKVAEEIANSRGKMCSPQTWTGKKGTTVEQCWEIIKAMSHCSQEFFNHATDGDRNCGCVTKNTQCDQTSKWANNRPVRIYATGVESEPPEPRPTPAPSSQSGPYVLIEGKTGKSGGGWRETRCLEVLGDTVNWQPCEDKPAQRWQKRGNKQYYVSAVDGRCMIMGGMISGCRRYYVRMSDDCKDDGKAAYLSNYKNGNKKLKVNGQCILRTGDPWTQKLGPDGSAVYRCPYDHTFAWEKKSSAAAGANPTPRPTGSGVSPRPTPRPAGSGGSPRPRPTPQPSGNGGTAYFKAAGAQNCPAGKMVDSETECRKAGASVGYPFAKSVSDANKRPAGCFWDQVGNSYFNKVLSARAKWTGVGAICKQASSTPAPPTPAPPTPAPSTPAPPAQGKYHWKLEVVSVRCGDKDGKTVDESNCPGTADDAIAKFNNAGQS